MPVRIRSLVALTAFAVAAMVATTASAQKKYDPGATDTEIKIGNIMPYSGPASAYATIGKTEQAGLDMKLVLETIETGVAASPQVIRHSKRMVARDFGGASFAAALRHKDAVYAVALAESLLSSVPLMGRAAVQAYDRARAYAPDEDEGKMIEVTSRPRNATP